MIFTCPASPRRVREQCHLARVLHGGRHVALVLRAVPRDPARSDLAPLRHELAQHAHVLVVDVVDLVLAEHADLRLLLLLPALLFFFASLPSFLRHRYTGVSSCAPPTPTVTLLDQSACVPGALVFSSLAVAHFRLGPTSSASISIFERFSPSAVSHEFVRSRPTTTTRLPCVRVSATFSASCRHAVTSK